MKTMFRVVLSIAVLTVLPGASGFAGPREAGCEGIWFQVRPDTICRALQIDAGGIVVRTWLVPPPGAAADRARGGPGYIMLELTDSRDGIRAMVELGIRELSPARLRAAGFTRTDCWPGVGFASNLIKGSMIRLYRLNVEAGEAGH